MARLSALTQGLVDDVADQLKAQGKKTSPNAVREMIGTGSFSTIQQMLEIRAEQQEQNEKIPVSEMPEFTQRLLEKLHRDAVSAKLQGTGGGTSTAGGSERGTRSRENGNAGRDSEFRDEKCGAGKIAGRSEGVALGYVHKVVRGGGKAQCGCERVQCAKH